MGGRQTAVTVAKGRVRYRQTPAEADAISRDRADSREPCTKKSHCWVRKNALVFTISLFYCEDQSNPAEEDEQRVLRKVSLLYIMPV